MENKNNSFLWRLYLISSILLIFGIGIGYKLFYLQFVDGEKYRKIAEDKTLKSFTVNSVRGNIFSEDGSLLATSTTKYDIYFDSKTVSKNTFYSEIKNLTTSLSNHLGREEKFWYNYIIDARENGNRFLPIAKNISQDLVQKLKTFPILRYGSIRGGLIIERKIKRDYPLGKIAERTIGYERIDEKGNYRGVGLEHAFGPYLRGKNGQMIKRKISNGQW